MGKERPFSNNNPSSLQFQPLAHHPNGSMFFFTVRPSLSGPEDQGLHFPSLYPTLKWKHIKGTEAAKPFDSKANQRPKPVSQ
jgi:hypothetical protein